MLPWLKEYPDKEITSLIFVGFSEGFPVPEFKGEGCLMVKNLKSVDLFPDVVREKIAKELASGRVAGPFKCAPFVNFRISPLGVVPKKESS